MPIVMHSIQPLSQNKMIEQLRTLRHHSLVDSSDFAVSAVLEFKLEARSYLYISGVNVESPESNRLSLHAEQNAIAAARALLGKSALFTKIWVMGGPKHVEAGEDRQANIYIDLCGHCRQVLLPFAAENNTRYRVTINGEISEGDSLNALLPNAFCEKDLGDEKFLSSPQVHSTPSVLSLPQLFFVNGPCPSLSASDIHALLQALCPKLINPKFETSGVISCILKVNSTYVPGVLVQDAAFLVTDAVYAALGFAMASFGPEKLDLQEVHLYGPPNAKLVANELDLIRRFAQDDVPIHFYTARGLTQSYRLVEYKQEKDKAWLEKFEPSTMA